MKLSSCILLCLLLWAGSGNAAEIVLTDGSRVFGTILSLEDAEDLRVDTEHMDVVTVDWDAVDSISATAALEVELFDGRRIYGPLVVSGDSVRAGFGDGRSVDRSQVFRIEEYNQTFQDAVELYTDLGMNVVRGNNVVTQVSTGAGFRYNGERFETKLDATAIVNEQTDGTDLRRTTLRSTYTWKLRDNWNLSGLYSYEADEQQGLDSRTLLGAAIGNRIINNRRLRLELFSGLALNTEDFDTTAERPSAGDRATTSTSTAISRCCPTWSRADGRACSSTAPSASTSGATSISRQRYTAAMTAIRRRATRRMTTERQ